MAVITGQAQALPDWQASRTPFSLQGRKERVEIL
jgi:hypothetical protein